MRCITDSEISEWLRRYKIQKDPYHGEVGPDYYLQFYAPDSHGDLDALTRHYFDRIISGSVALVHMTDWALYKPSEMIAVTGIRSIHGENRWLIEAPGHLIGPDETELGISLFALSASFGWTAYLYSPLDSAILLNWEGEIFDYWTDNQQALSEMRKSVV